MRVLRNYEPGRLKIVHLIRVVALFFLLWINVNPHADGQDLIPISRWLITPAHLLCTTPNPQPPSSVITAFVTTEICTNTTFPPFRILRLLLLANLQTSNSVIASLFRMERSRPVHLGCRMSAIHSKGWNICESNQRVRV